MTLTVRGLAAVQMCFSIKKQLIEAPPPNLLKQSFNQRSSSINTKLAVIFHF